MLKTSACKYKSSWLQFFRTATRIQLGPAAEKFSENNSALSDEKHETSSPSNGGGMVDLLLLRTL